jgi:hypothetical protein
VRIKEFCPLNTRKDAEKSRLLTNFPRLSAGKKLNFFITGYLGHAVFDRFRFSRKSGEWKNRNHRRRTTLAEKSFHSLLDRFADFFLQKSHQAQSAAR